MNKLETSLLIGMIAAIIYRIFSLLRIMRTLQTMFLDFHSANSDSKEDQS